MAWRVAKSLETLRAQINAAYPNRSKSSDGTIGNAEHSARESDHNPNEAGVVCALDITHDPAHGVDAGAMAERLRQSKDRRIKYIISNARIANYQAVNGEAAWTWRSYHGKNDHRHHFHVSVRPEPSLYDDVSPWIIGGAIAKPLPVPVPAPSGRFNNITATEFGGADDPNASAYGGQVDPNKPGVALPFRFSGTRPKVRVFHNGKSVVCDIVDVGPWNTSDPYWKIGKRPQAETGKDIRGRTTNLAGIDLTPSAAKAIGLQGKGQVDWEFVGAAVAPAPTKPPVPEPAKEAAKDAGRKGIGALIVGGLVAFFWWLVEHPVYAILGTAALVAACWFGWHWWKSRAKVSVEIQPTEQPLIVQPNARAEAGGLRAIAAPLKPAGASQSKLRSQTARKGKKPSARRSRRSVASKKKVRAKANRRKVKG